MLMDVRMPVMDGPEAMRQMQKDPALCNIPVVAVSAGVTEEESASCRNAGARAFLTKPIDNSALLDVMRNLLGLTWIRDARQPPALPDSDSAETFVVPNPMMMETLRELVMTGNMRAIREKAAQFITLDARYRPFAERLTQLASGYQSKALLRLVEKHASQNR
jgi:CheY-like chemotaxis protein